MDYEAVIKKLTFGRVIEYLKFAEKLEEYKDRISRDEVFSYQITPPSSEEKRVNEHEIIYQLQEWNVLEVKNKEGGHYLLLVSSKNFNNLYAVLKQNVPILEVVNRARQEAQETLKRFIESGTFQAAIRDIQNVKIPMLDIIRQVQHITPITTQSFLPEPHSPVLLTSNSRLNELEWDLEVRKTHALERIVELLEQNPNRPSSEILEKLNDEALIAPKLSGTDIKKRLAQINKTLRLGPKEKKLLDTLSDGKKYKTKELDGKIPTKDHRKLKEALQKKIRGTGFYIKTVKSDGLFQEPCYQLDYLTDIEIENQILASQNSR